MKRTLTLLAIGAAIGAWSQNAIWDLENLAWDYGLWFTFVPAIPALAALVLLRRTK
jgi:hypothetical protein